MNLGRVVKWIGDIDQKSYDRVLGEIVALMKQDSTETIFLMLLSNGGESDVGFSFYDTMKIMRPNLITIGTGIVRSIAPIILAAGRTRLLTENTTLLFHDFFAMDMDAEGKLDSKLLISFGKDLESGMKKYCKILAVRSEGKLSERKIRALMHNQKSHSVDEALKLGLADFMADSDVFDIK